MSNFVHQLDDNEAVLQSTINLAENGADGSTPSNTRSKRKRNLPGNPDPDAEVVALSPTTLMATNRYICEVCHKGFRRDQNLQLHRRGHNLPWKLKQRANAEVKKRVFVCPDPNCVHHDPSRALGDLTGIKKHFCRKHGEKKWKCHKCSKRYAVQSDWKAHTKICGTRDYHCDCGTIFSRKDSFVTHRAFCEAITEEHYKVNNQNHIVSTGAVMQSQVQELFTSSLPISSTFCSNPKEIMDNSPEPLSSNSVSAGILNMDPIFDPRTNASPMEMASSYKSATALLQKATTVGAKISNNSVAPLLLRGFTSSNTNSFKCVHEGYPVVGSGLASITATTNNGSSFSFPLSVGHQEPRHGYAPIIQSGMSESPLFVISDDENYGNQLAAEEMYRNRCEKMTVDFLGVKLAGHSGIHKKTSYEDNNMGLRDLSMQQSLHNLHS